MFDIFNFARKRRLSFEQLQTLQMVSQQVVLSLEGSIKIPGAAKKALALKLMGELLEQIGIVAPESLIDTVIEASDGDVTPSALKILKALDLESTPPPMPTARPLPSFKLDIGDRSSRDNPGKGLSL